MIDDTLIVYTDGSCLPSPRRGGIGIRIITVNEAGDEQYSDFSPPGFKNVTNNEMELYACVVALKEVINMDGTYPFSKVEIYTDSQYVANNHKNAMFVWPTTRWSLKDGKPAANTELWKEFIKLQ